MKNIELKPVSVFRYFDEICHIPRPSKKEEKIIAYLKEFGENHNLETVVDDAGNVLIRKPATSGNENLKTVILQSHVDMVCEKNSEVVHDFMVDPIETYVDGEWMRAKGTTLGADNGIGVATQLAILDAKDIEHGPLECLFTVDEETGLSGAFALKEGFLKGDILINLDSEDEGELFIGCAGGINTIIDFTYNEVEVPQNYFFFRIDVKGLTGGHSGDDIEKKRANANKLLNRFLYKLNNKYDLYLSEINGGNLRNAIPREAYAVCAVEMKHKEDVRVDLNLYAADIENEYSVSEPNLKFVMQSESPRQSAIDKTTLNNLINSIMAVHNGIYAMSQDMPDLVETSSNLASVKMPGNNIIKIETSQRSSILSSRDDMQKTISAAFILGGANVTSTGGYPGWKPNPSSPILKIAIDAYERLFGIEPKVKAIHAGLECGLFLEKYPSLDMFSFGPTLRGVHSPDERMHIPSVDRYWRHLLEVLKNIPVKA